MNISRTVARIDLKPKKFPRLARYVHLFFSLGTQTYRAVMAQGAAGAQVAQPKFGNFFEFGLEIGHFWDPIHGYFMRN